MIRFFLILSVLFLNIESIWSEELTKQEIRFLQSIDRMDKKNEVLGESIPFEVKSKMVKVMTDMLSEGFSLSSGLALINLTSEGTEMKGIYRANVDISNYGKDEIRDLQEFLLNRFKQDTCSDPRNRAFIFVLDYSAKYEFIDNRNRPFGEEMEFKKAACKGIKTIGRPIIFPEDWLKEMLKEYG